MWLPTHVLDVCIGSPADSDSPVALRPGLAAGLPFR